MKFSKNVMFPAAFALFVAAILLSTALVAQPPQSAYKEIYKKKFLESEYPQLLPILFRTYPVYQSDSTYRVYLPTAIRLDFFQYLYNDGNYDAGAEVEVIFRHKKSNLQTTRIWQTEVTVNDFKSTHNKRRFHTTIDSLDLIHGQYDLIFKYRDLHGQQVLSYRQKLTLQPAEGRYLSPVLFYDPQATTEQSFFNGQKIIPSALQAHWHFNRDLAINLNVWLADTSEVMPLRVELLNTEAKSVIFKRDTLLAAGDHHRRLRLTIPASQLPEGRHRIKLVYGNSSTPADSVRKHVPFDVIWFDKPLSLWSPELTVMPLQHILDAPEYKMIRDGNREKQLNKVKQFWAEKDPTPETPFNELQKVFYTRVDSVLARFSTRRKLGWETDPGKIYIAHGPPDEIDDRSLDPVDDPYLRWTYIINGKRLTYTFRAVNGRKEYRLEDASESSM